MSRGDLAAPPAEVATQWTPSTESPRLASVGPQDRQVLAPCGRIDTGLMQVAQKLAEHQASSQELLDSERVSFEMRAAGVPYVWPRAWAIVGEATPEEAAHGLETWLRSFDDGGERRCGLGRATSPLGDVLAVVALDAIADLEPVPRQARLGQWVEIRARLLIPATEVEVVVLGPRGAPHGVPSSFDGSWVRARVPVDAPGPWLLQVLPTLETGPRPAAEALVFVDTTPPAEFRATAVPGEEVARLGPDPPAGLLAMLNAARASERLAPLRRHPELDVAAQVHATAMQRAGVVAHDAGAGGPTERLQALGLAPSIAGENVARASDLVRAHRALWASPSHRSNMLHSRFTDVGVGVAVSEDGSLWVCEVFASF